jgi:hypothetical protein
MTRRTALSFGFCSLICAIAATLVRVAAAADPAATSLPRYQFKVGQELIYHEVDETRYAGGGKSGGTKDWQLWVVRQNNDGS